MDSGKKETALYLILRFASKALAYPVLYLLANLFTKDDYGRAVFCLSFFHLATTLLFLGLPQALVPFIVRERDLSSITGMLVLVTAVATAIAAGIAVAIPLAWPLVVSVPFLLVHRLELAIFQSRHQHHFYQVSMLGHVIAPLVLLYFFRDRGSVGIVLAYAIGFVLTPLLTAPWLARDLWRLFARIRLTVSGVVREYLAAAGPLALIGLSFMILGWLDTAVLGFMRPYDDVAAYNIVSALANAIGIAPLAIAMYVLTRSAQVEDDEAARLLLGRALRISASLALGLSVILGSLLGVIVAVFFAPYIGTERYAAILLMGVAFYSFYIVGVNYLAGRFSAADALVPMLVAMALNLVLDVALVPSFGLDGIVAATTAAHACAFVLLHRKIGAGSRYYLLFAFAPISLAAHALGAYGLLLLVPLAALLFATRLLSTEDVRVVVRGLTSRRG